MQGLLQYPSTSMKVSPCLSSSGDSLMAPLFAPVRWVYLNLPPHTLQSPSLPTPPFRVRKQPRNGPREEKVPYLIISSHNEKHTAQGFYMAAAAGVGFPLARVRLVRGLIVRLFWLNEVTRWWGTSAPRISDIWASLVGICQDKSHKLWSQAEWTDSQHVCVCERNKDTGHTPNHTSSFLLFLSARPPVCGL